MPTKKTKIRRGAFVHERIEGTGPDAGKALQGSLKAASPQGRIDKWKPHATRLNVALDHLAEAQGLLDVNGKILSGKRDAFNLQMQKAIADIENAQVDESLVPQVEARQKQLHAQKSKKNLALMELARELVSKYPDASASFLFARISTASKARRIDGVTIFREADRIVLRSGRKATSIKARSWANYIKDARELQKGDNLPEP